MEVKTNPFYELRNRLYASAAAGCSLIAEDFRLKRAVEAFQPMSEANKVFGKLYAMCNALLASADPAADIIDCIALADALAVTQGTFADDSETAPAPVCNLAAPLHLTVNDVNVYSEMIRKIQYGYGGISDKTFYEIAADPRLLSVFSEIAGRNSTNVAEVLVKLEGVYGEPFLEFLFSTLDIYNKNATGNQLRFISTVAKGRFNDKYTELAEDESVSSNIRLAAIEAMQYCSENEERLMTLYQTSKGKIKQAALMALVRMNAPSVDPLIEKAAAKPKSGDFEMLCESGCKIAEDYARQENEFFIAFGEQVKNEKHPFARGHIDLLANKKNVYDVFEKLGEYYSREVGEEVLYSKNPRFYDVNYPLVKNLYLHDDKIYIELINALFEKYPVVYAYSAFIAALIQDPESACKKICRNHLAFDWDMMCVINKIFRTPDGWYRIKMHPCITEDDYTTIKLFKKVPDDMIEFLTDQSVLYDYREMDKIFKSTDAINNAVENMRYRCIHLSTLIRICDDDERDRLKAAAAEYTWAMAKKYPISQTLTFLKEFDGKPLEEGMIYNYTKFSESATKDNYSWKFTIERSKVSKEVIKKDCQKIIKDFSDNVTLMTQVNKMLKEIETEE